MIKTDSNGNILRNKDLIKTSRGAILMVIEKDGELYVKNSGNNQISPISVLKINFYLYKRKY